MRSELMKDSCESFTTVVDEPEADGLRADKYIAEYLQLFTRSQLKQRGVEFKLNGKRIKPAKQVHFGEKLEIRYSRAPAPRIEAEEIKLDILYEDSRVIVVNKAQGMVVHPAAGNFSGTLVQGLLYHIESLGEHFSEEGAEAGGETKEAVETEVRPGIVHRLDKDTSGVIIAAKDPEALDFLARQFAERKTRKTYIAEIKGVPSPPEGRVTYPIARDRYHRKKFTWRRTDGKAAETEYRILRCFEDTSLVRLRPKTGRTHQLRVHMSALGCPVVGDPIYGRKIDGREGDSLMLHAYSLRIEVPGRGLRTFRAPLPERFRRVCRLLQRIPLARI